MADWIKAFFIIGLILIAPVSLLSCWVAPVWALWDKVRHGRPVAAFYIVHDFFGDATEFLFRVGLVGGCLWIISGVLYLAHHLCWCP